MSEEKKEIPQEKDAKVDAPAAAVETAKTGSTPAPAPKDVKVAAPKLEKPSNCSSCNKSIKKKRWYYRNGKFFCTKRCWSKTIKKEEKKEEAQGEKK